LNSATKEIHIAAVILTRIEAITANLLKRESFSYLLKA